MADGFFILGIIALIIILIFFISGLRMVREYERVVVFRLGRYVGVKGPGIFWINPLIEKTNLVDLRVQVIDIPRQEVITKDNIPVMINAVAYFHIVDPGKAVISVSNFYQAVFQIAQTTVRAVLGKVDLDEVLSEREKLNLEIREILDEAVHEWGVNINRVEIKDLEVPDSMKRAMARQAEAERERRSRILLAEGELQASQKLKEAGDMVGSSTHAMLIRFLQTIQEVSTENASTVILPIPIELLSFFSKAKD